jgi:hypothetical protein
VCFPVCATTCSVIIILLFTINALCFALLSIFGPKELINNWSGSGRRVNIANRQATGRKVRLITDVASTALGKEEMAVCL